MNEIRVGIVDDSKITRLGLRIAIEAEPDMMVVGEAGTVEEALRLGIELRPDIMLLDLKLRPEAYDGPDICRKVLAASPQTKVIALTGYSQDAMVMRCLNAGAKGYVIKDVETDDLLKMMRAVHEGASVLDPQVLSSLLSNRLGRTSHVGSGLDGGVESLSETDFAIIGHLSRGLTNKEIAQHVHLSPSTVKDHLERLCISLGVRSRSAIVGEAYRRGII